MDFLTSGVGLPTGQQLAEARRVAAISQSGKIFVDAIFRFYILDYVALSKLSRGTQYVGEVPGYYSILSAENTSNNGYPDLHKVLGVEKGTTFFVYGGLEDGGNHVVSSQPLARYNRGFGGAINDQLQIAFPVRYYKNYNVHKSDNLSEQAIVLGTPGKPLLDVPIRADGNRDGTITFDATDDTTSEKPYTFWINDNSDTHANEEEEDQDPAKAQRDYSCLKSPIPVTLKILNGFKSSCLKSSTLMMPVGKSNFNLRMYKVILKLTLCLRQPLTLPT